MPIRYKVVNLNRYSCFVNSSRYSLRYLKGSIVKAPKHTLGIFCFEKREYAEDFVKQARKSKYIFKIVKVETIGRGRKLLVRPTVFCNNFINILSEDKKIFLRYMKEGIESLRTKISVPVHKNNFKFSYDGTMVYPAVKVLE